MRVTWTIDIDADTPLEAAAQALAIMRDPGSTAVVFDVDGTTVDLEVTARLEELRTAIRAERISWGELAELQGLARFIEDGDVELLEWAGVPEGSRP